MLPCSRPIVRKGNTNPGQMNDGTSAARMNSPRSLEFAPPDVPLREDVRRLGALVGDMLAEQVSPEFLAEVERVRTTAIARRQAGEPPQSLAGLLDGQSPAQAEALIRAFSTYFQVVNIAERVHRIRRRQHNGSWLCHTAVPWSRHCLESARAHEATAPAGSARHVPSDRSGFGRAWKLPF